MKNKKNLFMICILICLIFYPLSSADARAGGGSGGNSSGGGSSGGNSSRYYNDTNRSNPISKIMALIAFGVTSTGGAIIFYVRIRKKIFMFVM